MGSLEVEEPPIFPTIDISPFLTPSTPAHLLTSTAQSLASACTSPGFFYLTHHDLPTSLTDRVLALARDFFLKAPEAEKDRLKRKGVGVDGGDGARGYQIIGDNVTEGKRDWHEAVDWYRPIRAGEPFSDVKEGGGRSLPFDLLQGMNAWPTAPSPEFRIVYEEYICAMLELGTAILRAMGMALGEGMEVVFVRNTRESFWVMRAIGYPPLPGTMGNGSDGTEGGGEGHDGVSCGAHSDYGCVTLLLSDGTKGALQAWVEGDGEGEGEEGRWVAVDPVEGALVVNM